jgi:hypothetical protein
MTKAQSAAASGNWDDALASWLDQATLGAADDLGAGANRDLVAALAWPNRARQARSKSADNLAGGAGCSTEQRQAAERRAGLPLDREGPGP